MDSPRWCALKQELTDIEDGFYPSFKIYDTYDVYIDGDDIAFRDMHRKQIRITLEKLKRIRTYTNYTLPVDCNWVDDFRRIPKFGYPDNLEDFLKELSNNGVTYFQSTKYTCVKNLMVRNKYTNESNVPILHSVSCYDYPQELQSYLLKLRRDNSQFDWEDVCREYDMEKLTPQDCALYIRHFYYSSIYKYPHRNKEINPGDILYVPVFMIS